MFTGESGATEEFACSPILADTKFTCQFQDCEKKDQVFHTLDDLGNHISDMHIKLVDKSYRCFWEGCSRIGKPFARRHKLVEHVRTHTGEKPFKCTSDGCGKRFARPDARDKHSRTTHKTTSPVEGNGTPAASITGQHAQTAPALGCPPISCPFIGCRSSFYRHEDVWNHLNRVHQSQVSSGGQPMVSSSVTTTAAPVSASSSSSFSSTSSTIPSSQTPSSSLSSTTTAPPLYPYFDPRGYPGSSAYPMPVMFTPPSEDFPAGHHHAPPPPPPSQHHYGIAATPGNPTSFGS